ncbi:uncharacterized protein PSFLO_03733 [Pseudozyma flocculosa]|uniref:Uncharacterized protein n=1 Tax=Pseudozyma flocculosa TaxID=84751 RepID=A0A5C3F2W8_9BASI|nr:uncharacterized protein PSFLO_03733 [Pseudozyma flocculosa]
MRRSDLGISRFEVEGRQIQASDWAKRGRHDRVGSKVHSIRIQYDHPHTLEAFRQGEKVQRTQEEQPERGPDHNVGFAPGAGGSDERVPSSHPRTRKTDRDGSPRHDLTATRPRAKGRERRLSAQRRLLMMSTYRKLRQAGSGTSPVLTPGVGRMEQSGFVSEAGRSDCWCQGVCPARSTSLDPRCPAKMRDDVGRCLLAACRGAQQAPTLYGCVHAYGSS